jgi:hypothetical protein
VTVDVQREPVYRQALPVFPGKSQVRPKRRHRLNLKRLLTSRSM